MGLLGDMTIKQTERLIISKYQDLHSIQNSQQGVPKGDLEDYFCQVTGGTTRTEIRCPLSRILNALFIPGLLYFVFLPLLSDLLDRLDYHFMRDIMFGWTDTDDQFHNHHFPSNGWVTTVGAEGNKTLSGTFIGNIRDITYPYSIFASFTEYIGITGFSGFIIDSQGGRYFLGNAIRVNLKLF
jgi:hypothetical protein